MGPEIIWTLIATLMEPEPPTATVSEQATTKLSTIADVMATIEIKVASNFVVKSCVYRVEANDKKEEETTEVGF